MKMFNKLMAKIMLSCVQATKLSAVKNYRKLGFVEKMQLKMHLFVCSNCKAFHKQGHQIEEAVHQFLFDEKYLSEKHLSEEKKSKIQNTVDQELN